MGSSISRPLQKLCVNERDGCDVPCSLFTLFTYPLAPLSFERLISMNEIVSPLCWCQALFRLFSFPSWTNEPTSLNGRQPEGHSSISMWSEVILLEINPCWTTTARLKLCFTECVVGLSIVIKHIGMALDSTDCSQTHGHNVRVTAFCFADLWFVISKSKRHDLCFGIRAALCCCC